MQKTNKKILSAEKASEQVRDWKNAGEIVVFTNGCFDILHLGHIDYLENARSLGDRLVVGVNTDNSVKRIKGNNRPVMDENSRVRVLAALEFVDTVILFDEETPYELINALKPDILVKGNDYLAENIVGADIVKKNGGKVVTLELVEGYSTSGIIEKIQKNE